MGCYIPPSVKLIWLCVIFDCFGRHSHVSFHVKTGTKWYFGLWQSFPLSPSLWIFVSESMYAPGSRKRRSTLEWKCGRTKNRKMSFVSAVSFSVYSVSHLISVYLECLHFSFCYHCSRGRLISVSLSVSLSLPVITFTFHFSSKRYQETVWLTAWQSSQPLYKDTKLWCRDCKLLSSSWSFTPWTMRLLSSSFSLFLYLSTLFYCF